MGDSKGLFKWENMTKKSRSYSRSQRVTTEDDIQNWLLKVEEASEEAVSKTFGNNSNAVSRKLPGKQSSKQTGRAEIQAHVADARIHEAAYAEAEELLQQWVDEKIDLNTSQDIDVQDTVYNGKTRGEVRREWDHLLDDTDSSPTSNIVRTDTSHYNLADDNEEDLVNSFLQSLMNKDLTKQDRQWQNVMYTDDNTAKPDPTLRMQLRHKQVRENRMKREKEKMEKLKRDQQKKDAQLKARQIVQKEEEVKHSKKRQEEQKIQQEMAEIRRAMEEERREREESRRREQQAQLKAERELNAQIARDQALERQSELTTKQQAEQKQRFVLQRMKELEAREAADKLKILQSAFSAWYSVVLERRLQLGRVKATRDWRLLVRTFNVWKGRVRSRRAEEEAQQHHNNLLTQHRQEVIAASHYKRRLLWRCFLAWRLHISQEQTKKNIAEMQQQTQSKMAAFLQAAATGKLKSESDKKKGSAPNTPKLVDEMFSDHPTAQSTSPHSDQSSPSHVSTGSKPGHNKPTQAWQITRKHAKLSKKEEAEVCKNLSPNNEDTSDPSNTTSAPRKQGQKKFVVNNLEHRHAAQQKILQLQQKQLHEQQRLIEEMQFLQRQQLLQQQLGGQGSKGEGDGAEESGTKNQRSAKELHHTSPSNGLDTQRTESSLTTISDIQSDLQSELTQRSEVTSRSEVSQRSKSTTADSSTPTANAKHLKFLHSMESRASERARMKKEREAKRRKAEEERIAQLEAEAVEKARQDEEEKRRRVEMFREKKRLEKQKEEEKQQQLEKMKQLSAAADDHYQRALLKYRGWLPWRCLLTMASDRQQKAENHYREVILRKVFTSWHSVVSADVQRKNQTADQFHSFLITRRYFKSWRRAGQYMSILEQKADRHYQGVVLVKVLTAWADITAEEKVQGWHNERIAREHNTVRIQKTALRCWRRFPSLMREEEEREKRRAEMRKKVSSMLPDYRISTDSPHDSDSQPS